VLANHSSLGRFVFEGDCDALTALQDISCRYSADMAEFTLTFRFGENAHFSNHELVKVYRMAPDLLDEHCPVLLSIDSVYPIFWKSKQSNLCDPVYVMLRARVSLLHAFSGFVLTLRSCCVACGVL
jgi:hypothetical protein